jgi:hypothetical protein
VDHPNSDALADYSPSSPPCITEAEARDIIECYGPCTALYECKEPADLVSESRSSTSLFGFIAILERCEQVCEDRMLDACAEGEPLDHSGLLSEIRASRERRLIALEARFGWTPDWEVREA